MKKTVLPVFGVILSVAAFYFILNSPILEKEAVAETSANKITKETVKKEDSNINNYKFPEFYRGIYLNYWSGKDPVRLNRFINSAKKANVNAFVIDVQPSKNGECRIPESHIKKLIDNGIHPIARIVCFDQGLRHFPVSQKKINFLHTLALNSAKAGFKEIQFDYIRFNDSNALRHVSLEKKYDFVQTFLKDARKKLADYDVRIAADVFGRIPLNTRDIIGQNMEVLDPVTDVICPMAYPSHYTWSKKMIRDPYYTVHKTSKRARERTKNAKIVSYIQAFQIKIPKSMTYSKYISEQIKACHDSEISGYIFWNARQKYAVPFQVMENYYKKVD